MTAEAGRALRCRDTVNSNNKYRRYIESWLPVILDSESNLILSFSQKSDQILIAGPAYD
jgi:hypothetical protein